jgi:hypothetical protein
MRTPAEPLKRLIGTLREMADTAVTLKPFSVTDKLEMPPSGMSGARPADMM